ncbi:putative 37S ribosomal protein S11 [Phyllosticta capitalensis]
MQSTRQGLRAASYLIRPASSICRTSIAFASPVSASVYSHKSLSTTARILQSKMDHDPQFSEAIANLAKAIPSKPAHETANYMGKVVGGQFNQKGLQRTMFGQETAPEPHHLHVVCSKHNTHITLTKPDRNPIISVSAGNLGFRKHHRSSFDAAYQLGAWVLTQIQERGLHQDLRQLEVVFRGFGDGREAVRKVIMGSEGMSIRSKIVKVSDATKLKFGGTRSKKPRRLG